MAAAAGLALVFIAAPSAGGEPALGLAGYQRREALLRAESDGAGALPRLRGALDDESAAVRRTAVHVLARLGPPARAPLREALDHADGEVRRLAYGALPADWVRTHRLAKALTDPEPITRNWVSLHLARHPPGTAEDWASVRDPLARLLSSDDAGTRLRAVRIIVAWEGGADRFADFLETAARDADGSVRQAAQQGLWPFDRAAMTVEEAFAGRRLVMAEEYPVPREGWRFKPEDPARPGHRAGWYARDFDDGAWDRIAIEQAWGEAGFEGFIGVGWYRRTLDLPPAPADAAELHFGAVDESAWVWVNGQYVGARDIGSSGWDVPFSMDVTGFVRWGEGNQVTVRVLNTAGAGGIWRPVTLRRYREP